MKCASRLDGLRLVRLIPFCGNCFAPDRLFRAGERFAVAGGIAIAHSDVATRRRSQPRRCHRAARRDHVRVAPTAAAASVAADRHGARALARRDRADPDCADPVAAAATRVAGSSPAAGAADCRDTAEHRPARARLSDRLRLQRCGGRRYLDGGPGRPPPDGSDEGAKDEGERQRAAVVAGRHAHRLRLRPGRRCRHLGDERRWDGRAESDARAGRRPQPPLVAGRQADRLRELPR